MNLSEKLAAADGAAEPAADAGAGSGPPRNRRAGDPGGPPAPTGRRRLASPESKAHPMRRASDRAALDEAWKSSKQKVQTKVLAEIGPTAADLSPNELARQGPLHRQRDPRARGPGDLARSSANGSSRRSSRTRWVRAARGAAG